MTTVPEKKKNNKKMLLIALLALLVLMTSIFIGTLAKYVTSETMSDDAVVAKFGLNVPNTIELFSDKYDNVEADTADKKIIAPGTSGSHAFVVEGTSEVAYRVDAGITVTYSEEWGEYAPLEFSLDGNTWTSLTTFETNLANALESNVMEPNQTYENGQTIYWKWPFHTSDENDVKDTELGIAASEGTAPQVTITLELIAMQVD